MSMLVVEYASSAGVPRRFGVTTRLLVWTVVCLAVVSVPFLAFAFEAAWHGWRL